MFLGLVQCTENQEGAPLVQFLQLSTAKWEAALGKTCPHADLASGLPFRTHAQPFQQMLGQG